MKLEIKFISHIQSHKGVPNDVVVEYGSVTLSPSMTDAELKEALSFMDNWEEFAEEDLCYAPRDWKAVLPEAYLNGVYLGEADVVIAALETIPYTDEFDGTSYEKVAIRLTERAEKLGFKA